MPTQTNPLKMTRFVAVFVLASVALTSCVGRAVKVDRYEKMIQRYLPVLEKQIHRDLPGTLSAGTSKVEITPPVGTPLGGYARRRGKPSQGIHDPVYARVLALRDASDLVFLVSCDLIAVNEAFFEAVYQQIRKESEIGREDLLLFATHNHSGPGAIGRGILEQAILGKFNRKVFDEITSKIGEAALKASQSMEAVTVRYAETSLDGWIENRMIDDGPVDSELKFLRVDDLNGKPKAVLVNLAAHPTVLPARNFLMSADYPGSLQNKIEEAYPGAVALFADGAGGDMRIRAFGELTDFERAEKVGTGLAAEVLKKSEETRPIAPTEISSLGTLFPLPPVQIKFRVLGLPRWMGRLLLDRTAYFEIIRLGDILLIGVPAELGHEIGKEIKDEAEKRGYEAFIIGYANDYMGYVVPEKDYDPKQYETRASFYGKTMDSYLKEIVYAQMKLLGPFVKEEPTSQDEQAQPATTPT